ncbi:MAG: 5-(carboxyamino)imidazole ribonucleotide mutase, partial [Gammaproteobacteria bacterium]|nr:5-(carboxyamino)imidazole ribonucleotide mutase [Gammaproteobacteria bacterium]
AYLAAQTLALSDLELGRRLDAERRENADAVVAKDQALQAKLSAR